MILVDYTLLVAGKKSIAEIFGPFWWQTVKDDSVAMSCGWEA